MRFLLLFLAAMTAAVHAAENTPRVFTIGDSTMANYRADIVTRGWGMAFRERFTDPGMVRNHAVSGRSTRSFRDEGHWQKVADQLQAGDFVIIQFSHNDEKVEIARHGTDPATTFRANLRRYIQETRAKEATPILATPVARRKFNAAGRLVASHGAYPDAIRAVAAEEKVPLLELEHATEQWLRELGDEPSRKFFIWKTGLKEGQSPDNTHFVEAGAAKVADLAVAEIRALKLPLVTWLK